MFHEAVKIISTLGLMFLGLVATLIELVYIGGLILLGLATVLVDFLTNLFAGK
jgi:hypothetical protein